MTVLSFAFCWVVLGSANLYSGDEAAPFVLKALRTERSRLESGRCVYTGFRVLQDPAALQEGFDTTVSGEIVFQGDRYRIDCIDPEMVIDPASTVPTNGGGATSRTIRGVCRKSYAFNGIDVSFWLSFQPMAAVASSANAFVPEMIKAVCLDVRCPTVFSIGNWRSGQSWSEALSYLESDEIPWQVKKLGGHWELSFVNRDDRLGMDTKWVFVIDTSNGFVPIRLSTTVTGPDGRSFSEFEVLADWQEMKGVMVPVRLSRKAPSCPMKVRNDFFVVNLEWSDINQPIATDEFTYESFPTDPGTGVQNASTKEWLKPYPTIPVKPASLLPASRQSNWRIIVALNAALIFMLLAASVKKRCGGISILGRSFLVSAILIVAVVALAIYFALWPADPRGPFVSVPTPQKNGLMISSWSPVKPEITLGPEIDLGVITNDGRAHREVFITNNGKAPLTFHECISDAPGVQLFLPSKTIAPGERVGALLDCRLDGNLPLEDRIVSIRAVKDDGSEAFKLLVKAKTAPQ